MCNSEASNFELFIYFCKRKKKKTGIFFLPAWTWFVEHGSSSSSLGHWWHLSPRQHQAGETALPLDPSINYFQSSRDLYHSHAGACGAAAPLWSRLAFFPLMPFGKRVLLWKRATQHQKPKQTHRPAVLVIDSVTNSFAVRDCLVQLSLGKKAFFLTFLFHRYELIWRVHFNALITWLGLLLHVQCSIGGDQRSSKSWHFFDGFEGSMKCSKILL